MRDAISLLTTFGRRGGSITARACRWFPVVGAGLGGLLGGCWWLADRLWPAPVAAALVVLADLACTGMLHVDGLADSADGLLPHADRERRLAIMRTPDVGAFGVAAVVIALVLSTTALAVQSVSVLLLVGLWMTARATVAVVPGCMRYARDAGIASPLIEGASRWPVVAVPIGLTVAIIGSGLAGAAAVMIGAAAGIGILLLAHRRLGGFTGDVLGAVIVVTETVGLVVAAGRW
jgi:adenosylcobinamide-GDP ribazoletransferase